MSLAKSAKSTEALKLLELLLAQRIVILDGAMGTMIQALRLEEAEFRSGQYADHPVPLAGCNDLLSMTQPEAIVEIHRQYLEAGADIIQTNSFNANRISMADYQLESEVRAMNLAAAQCARHAIDIMNEKTPEKPYFVAGSIGPTNRSASLSPDVDDPAFRAVTFDQLVEAYYEQIDGLVAGGVDLLFPETTFDTLNLKACLFAIEKFFESQRIRIPVMASVTLTDRSGRTLSGQTLEAFWISVSHADLLSVGINCGLGPDLTRPYLEELSKIASVHISCHPNAGLPNEFGQYDLGPEQMAQTMSEFAQEGWLNIVGGCCGTRPEHIKAIAEAVRASKPRRAPDIKPLGN